jgi:hypothetical protein
MAGLPTVQVLLDDGTGTYPYDITTKARVQYGVSRGRQDEASQVNPGQLTLVLDNNDGRFTLGSTVIASPSPIKVNQRIRVKVTANGVTRNRFTGYVQQWPVEWPNGNDLESLVTVIATDAQARGERWPLKSVIEEEILSDSPVVYYTMGEPEGATSAADSSGNQQSLLVQYGTGPDVTFGTATGPSTDGLTAASFEGGKGLWPTAALSITDNVYEVAFVCPTAPAGEVGLIPSLVGRPGNEWRLTINSAGQLKIPGGAVSPLSYTDGNLHHVVLNVATGGLYVDGTLVVTGLPGASLVGTFNSFTGTLAHLAAYGSLSASRITAHYQAMTTGFAGEPGTTRLTRLAGYADLPIGTLDASLTNVAFTDITGKSTSEAMRQVADAEVGLLFVDGSGNLTFHNRNRPAVKTAPDITIAADALVDETQFQVDTQGVINYFAATAEGTKVTQVVRDSASETSHGRYPGSATYLVQTDLETLDRANWLVSTHAEPAPRVGSLPIDLLSLDAATQSALLGAEPNTWIRVTGLPPQTPGGTTADLMAQGFSELLTKDSWSITFNVVNRALFGPVWILGDSTYSVLGSTTRLYIG